MSLDQTLAALRELGVLIPEGKIEDTQLTNQAKALCPWTMSIYHIGDLSVATTRKGREGGEEFIADSPGEAAMGLLLQHLEGRRYSAFDTHYKQNAASQRRT